ncbi:MAG TPA: ABC transporter permease, partial [Opitutaceae bacterium]
FLGLIWSFMQPLLVLSVYAFVFILVFNGRFGVVPEETSWDYAIGIFLGLAVIQLFVDALTIAPAAILSHANYVKKVVFPLEILPATIVGASLYHLTISLGLALLATVIGSAGLHLSVLWIPFILIPLVAFALGVSWVMAGLGVFIRDLSFVTQFLSLLLMFTSGVFYDASRIPASFSVLRYNPLLLLIDETRKAFLWGIAPDTGTLVILYIVSLFVLTIGYAVFAKLRPVFADVI